MWVTVGQMTVLAVAWVIPGNRHDLAAMGYAEGRDGGVGCLGVWGGRIEWIGLS